MKNTRFIDWNSTLGTILFALIALGLSVGAYLSPETFFDDPRLMARIIPFAGPVIAALSLYRLVVYVELGPRIVFRRILGRHEYDWEQCKGLSMQEESTRYFFGLVRFSHQVLVFSVEDRGKLREYSYRVSHKKRQAIERIVSAHNGKNVAN